MPLPHNRGWDPRGDTYTTLGPHHYPWTNKSPFVRTPEDEIGTGSSFEARPILHRLEDSREIEHQMADLG